MKKIVIVLLLVAMIFSLSACSKSSYNKAVELLNSGNYSEAKQLFEELGDYKDSLSQIDECNYLLAKTAMEEKEYASAAEIFETLGNYKDAAAQVDECNYLSAKAAMENEEYASAAEMFEKLGDYKDAADCYSKCAKIDMVTSLFDKYCEKEWAEINITDEGIDLLLDTNPSNMSGHEMEYIDAFSAAGRINSNLGLPDSFLDTMGKVSAKDGTKSKEFSDIGVVVYWSYSSQCGFEVQYSFSYE